MPAPSISPAKNSPYTPPAVQRKCSECEEEEEKEKVQRKATAANPETAAAPPIIHDVLSSPGQPLDSATRAFFEPRFGYDFSRVRIHSGGKAGEAARAINALAYTVGPHIVFGAGQYAPGSTEGNRLLAHELTHTVQQSGGTHSFSIQRANVSVADSVHISPTSEHVARQPQNTEASDQVQSLAGQVEAALERKQEVAGVGDPAEAFGILAGISDTHTLLQVLVELDHRQDIDILIAARASAPQNNPTLLAALYAVKVASNQSLQADDPFLTQATQEMGQVPEASRDSILRTVIAIRYGEQYVQATMDALPALLESVSAQVAVPDTALQMAGANVNPLPWAPPGGQPIPFYIGNQAHIQIAAYYAAAHSGDVAFYNFTPMSTILNSWTQMGNTLTGTLSAANAILKPDIANLSRHHLYEIKPVTSQGLAVTEATMYMGLFTSVGIAMTLGPTGEPGTTGVVPAPGGVYIFSAPVPGAITYQYRRAQAVRVPVEEPSGERRWRIELRPLTPQEQAAIVTTTVGGMMLIMIMIALSPVGA
jgi:hypothetical protein